MKEIGYIYSLNCPKSGKPKYIGLTVRNPKERFSGHIKNTKKNNRRTSWIKGLLMEGLLPVMEIIDEVPVGKIGFWEEHYISLYKS